jgi:hypothetical protein
MTVGEWIEQYHKKSDGRFETFKKALELLNERSGINIIETGCVRLPDDWGGGMSTFLFGDYVKQFGGHLWTCDISAANMDCCREITKIFSKDITYVVNDSHAFLKDFNMTIDLLYLDSMDCPECDAIDSPVLLQSQNHQKREMELAMDKMAPNGIVLLDDNGFINGGKTRLTKIYLQEQGWREIMGGQQSLWVK